MTGPRLAAWGALALVLAGLLWALPPFWGSADHEVTVYAALDQEFSEPIFREYAVATGVTVRPKFDTEATKTVGLTQTLLAEARRPRADLFWNNEILNTLRLERAGLLAEYHSPEAAFYPAEFRSPRGTWIGFAARARVLVVNRERVPEAEHPRSVHELTAPRWRGQVGLAKPLFGTTATHAACLFAAWGPERAREFFRQARANEARILPGNKQVAVAVARGELAWGLTDTDDAIGQLEAGFPVSIVYPDQAPDQLGTLFVPNTLAIVRGGPHPAEARRLVDYLLSGQVEARLAAGPSAQIPLRQGVAGSARVPRWGEVRAMEIDFERAVDHWDEAARFLREEFTGP